MSLGHNNMDLDDDDAFDPLAEPTDLKISTGAISPPSQHQQHLYQISGASIVHTPSPTKQLSPSSHSMFSHSSALSAFSTPAAGSAVSRFRESSTSDFTPPSSDRDFDSSILTVSYQDNLRAQPHQTCGDLHVFTPMANTRLTSSMRIQPQNQHVCYIECHALTQLST